MKYIIRKTSRHDPQAPIWSGYSGETCRSAYVSPGKIYDTFNDAQIDVNSLNNHNTVGFVACAIDADIHVPIRIAHDYKLFSDHDALYVRWIPSYPDGGYRRYKIDVITRYTHELKYMIHLADPRQAGIDQITVEPSQKIEIKFDMAVLNGIAIALIDSGFDDKGHGFVQSMKAMAGDTSNGLPVRYYVEDLEQMWLAERVNPHHRTIFGFGDEYALTAMGKIILGIIEQRNPDG